MIKKNHLIKIKKLKIQNYKYKYTNNNKIINNYNKMKYLIKN